MGSKIFTTMLCIFMLIFTFISIGQSTLTTSMTLSSFGSINVESVRLHTDGRWIRDAAGNIVRLKGAAVFWRFMYCSNYLDYDPLLYDDEINEESIDLFSSSGANFIRLTVNGYIWYILKAQKYIAAVDTVIQWCKERGIMVVLDNHGWWNPETDSRPLNDISEWQNFMVALAQKYKNEQTVIGFDIWAEPANDFPNATNYYSMLPNVISAIHSVDPTFLCFVSPWGSSAETDDMSHFKNNPLPFSNIVYCAHNYYAWDFPWFDYAKNYGSGNYELAKQQMEALYYERWIHMIEADLPVMNMETGVYRDSNANPNWEVWENDSLALYEKYGVSVSWYPFDPDRSDSSLISILNSDRRTLTNVGEIWANHMTITS